MNTPSTPEPLSRSGARAPLDAGDFDPEDWIGQAIAAGMEPMVIVQSDGRRGMATKEIDIDRNLEPERYLTEAARTVIVDALFARGRVWNFGPGRHLADRSIIKLVNEFFQTVEAGNAAARDRRDAEAGELIDRNHDLWDEIASRTPISLDECASMLRFARELIERIEGDRAGIIDEPWARDVHRVCGSVRRLFPLWNFGPGRHLADRSIIKLVNEFFQTVEAGNAAARDRRDAEAGELIDRNHDLWDEIASRTPISLDECASMLRFARELIERIEGDRAGIIDEPWARDVHRVCGSVQDCLLGLSADARIERIAKRQAAHPVEAT